MAEKKRRKRESESSEAVVGGDIAAKRKKPKKSVDKSVVLTALCVVLCVLCVILGLSDAYNHGVRFQDEKVSTVNIADENDITSMGVSFYNNICKLESDIELGTYGLASSKHPFTGSFDGRGYNITVDVDVINESVFGYIGEGGVVENLSITVVDNGNIITEESLGAIIALENKGTIRNCSVIVLSEVVISNGGRFGIAVADNYGEISNLATYVTEISKASGLTKTVTFGSIAARNAGSVSNCFSMLAFDSEFPETNRKYVIQEKTAVNNTIGAITGIGESGVKADNCWAVIEDTNTYVADSETVKIYTDTSAVAYSDFVENLAFDASIWTNDNTYKLRLINNG